MALTQTRDWVVMHCVIKHASYAKAAEELALSPSGVSRVISRLEEGLGVRLLQRSTRKLSLTEAGHEFARRTEQLLAKLSEAEAEMAALASCPKGRMRIATTALLSQAIVRPLLSRLACRFPELSVELRVGDTCVDLVAEGFDLGFDTNEADAAEGNGVVSRPIAVDRRILVAAPSYLDAEGEPMQVADLSRHQCVMRSDQGVTHDWSLRGPTGIETVHLHSRFTANDEVASSIAAAQGLGIALTPTLAAARLLQGGELVRVLSDYEAEPMTVYARYPKAQQHSPKVLAVADFFATSIEKTAVAMGTRSGKGPGEADRRLERW